jgi:hypothetical protein
LFLLTRYRNEDIGGSELKPKFGVHPGQASQPYLSADLISKSQSLNSMLIHKQCERGFGEKEIRFINLIGK